METKSDVQLLIETAAAQETVQDGVVHLVQGIATQIQVALATGDMNAVTTLASELGNSAMDLALAVVAGTPTIVNGKVGVHPAAPTKTPSAQPVVLPSPQPFPVSHVVADHGKHDSKGKHSSHRS
jgi:hypothetical protein